MQRWQYGSFSAMLLLPFAGCTVGNRQPADRVTLSVEGHFGGDG
jgi:hypothetical protein